MFESHLYLMYHIVKTIHNNCTLITGRYIMKYYIQGAAKVVNLALFLLAMWAGLHDQNYAAAAFFMTLVIYNEINFKD